MNILLFFVIFAVFFLGREPFVTGKPLFNGNGANRSKLDHDNELDEFRKKITSLEEELLAVRGRLGKLEKEQTNSNHQNVRSAQYISGGGHNIVFVMPNDTRKLSTGDQVNYNRGIDGETGSYMDLTSGETDDESMEK